MRKQQEQRQLLYSKFEFRAWDTIQIRVSAGSLSRVALGEAEQELGKLVDGPRETGRRHLQSIDTII